MLTDRYLGGIPDDSRAARNAFLKKASLTEEKIEKIRKLNDMALSRGQSLAQMALGWVLSNDAVTSVLIGASRPEQILDCLKSLQSPAFSEEELIKIDEISNS